MEKFKWISGRQNTEYQKYCFLYAKLFNGLFVDGYLIKYNSNCVIPKHTDKVEGKRHFRLNIQLKGTSKFECAKMIFSIFDNKIVLFRPDEQVHSVVVGSRNRLILSLGVAI